MANIITALRFAFAVLLVCSEAFSAFFWLWYVCGGVSDLLDGPVARRIGQTSAAGAKLDSAADFLFIMCVGIAVVRSDVFPVWALMWAGSVALFRLISYGIGYFKYRTFAALHTVLNKSAGLILFMFPLLYRLLGMDVAYGIVCGVTFVSAIEELIITIRAKELDPNRKSILAL
ncbi:MAG: CDP-alcohol phosphatidyltransferase family protein [Clostridiaceae bacterium]|nr:CDP-alcohol phosphatidyltransferase family protein [Clostridiaceae bacterium]